MKRSGRIFYTRGRAAIVPEGPRNLPAAIDDSACGPLCCHHRARRRAARHCRQAALHRPPPRGGFRSRSMPGFRRRAHWRWGRCSTRSSSAPADRPSTLVLDRDQDRTVEQVIPFATGLDTPNGVTISDDGWLYVAENSRILGYPLAEFDPFNPQGPATIYRGLPAYTHSSWLALPGARSRRPALRRTRRPLQHLLVRRPDGRHRPSRPRWQQFRRVCQGHPQRRRYGLAPRDRGSLLHQQRRRSHGRRHPSRHHLAGRCPRTVLRISFCCQQR